MSRYMILQSDARRMPLADKSVHMVVTSPPYFGLRDYGTDGQIGLEASPQEYVDTIRKVFAEVWRVLRDDGVVFLNLGDSYASAGGAAQPHRDSSGGIGLKGTRGKQPYPAAGGGFVRPPSIGDCLKPKDLLGIPWRVAFALQSDGWYLRSDIIWHKKSPMPESVTDRPTKSHEYVFLLSKSERYFYDADAVKEETSKKSAARYAYGFGGNKNVLLAEANIDGVGRRTGVIGNRDATSGRNLRTVWTIASQPYPGSHFATMPRDLATRCIKAGTSEKGCCPHCGSPYHRITERTQVKRERPNDYVKRTGEEGTGNSCANTVAGVESKTVGWERRCNCPEAKPVPCVVLDPFNGAGTTGVSALALNRRYVGLEINLEYIAQSIHRIERPHAKVAVSRTTHDTGSLFEGLTP